jgi:flagellar motor protein MotB
MSSRFWLFILLLLLSGFLAAKSQEAAYARIDSLSVRLDQASAAGISGDDTARGMFREALIRVQHLQMREQKGKSIDALQLETAEMSVEAALCEIETVRTRLAVDDLRRRTAGLDVRIDSLANALARVQAGHIDDLRDEVRSARVGAQQARDEAEQTKEMLALQQEEAERARQRIARQKTEAEAMLSDLSGERITVRRDERGLVVILWDPLFEKNKALLTPELKTKLAKIAGIMSVYRQPDIRIEGHVDNAGRENQRLSDKRADAVRNFLVDQGVDSSRLSSEGFGAQKPLYTGTVAKRKAENRRVELVIGDAD